MTKADTPSGLPDIVPIDLNGMDEWREKIKNGTLPYMGEADGAEGSKVNPI